MSQMLEGDPAPTGSTVRVEKAVYGGDGLLRSPEGRVTLLPFVLPGELVRTASLTGGAAPAEIVEASPERVEPRCVHFGSCGGCQYQMASYPAQLRLKTAILEESLQRAGGAGLPAVKVWASPEPWGYRNRIRLQVREAEGRLRLGYNRRGSEAFLPIVMCPIAAPLLVRAVTAMEALAIESQEVRLWLGAARELELLCDAGEASLAMHLLCPRPPQARKGSLERMASLLKEAGFPLVSLQVSRPHRSPGKPAETFASWGSGGLQYVVGNERFWLEPGSFFQVNRFLLPRMVEIVCGGRRGALAWDLYAGAGLFARELAQRFAVVTAVEASAVAVAELRRGLRTRTADRAVAETTLGFLRAAVLQRERPELIVLDPPRAGAGEEACALLVQLAPETLVYVSCDPTTLARDLQVLQAGFDVRELHMLDLFPQTYHLETVMVLRRKGVAG